MSEKEKAAATRITIEYEDGSSQELKKGIVFYFEDKEREDSDHIMLKAECLSMEGGDLQTIVAAAVELGMELGMFSDECDGREGNYVRS